MSSTTNEINETFLISHGSPMLSIDDSLPDRQFLQGWKRDHFNGQKPKGILIVSGHWETDQLTVNAVNGACPVMYDFYGFPGMYELKYPAPGAPDLAKRVQEMLTGSGFSQVDIDEKRGLDHGAWMPLMLMYPEADIPVCQLSLQKHMDGTHHYNVGQALAPLKKEGVLIIGSGSATHNMREIRRDPTGVANGVPNWAAEFNNWLEEALTSGRHEDVNDYEKKAPYAKMAHPSPDHFYPLHVALGATGENAKAELIHRSWQLSHFFLQVHKHLLIIFLHNSKSVACLVL